MNASEMRAKIDSWGFPPLTTMVNIVRLADFLFLFSIHILISVISFDVGSLQPFDRSFFSKRLHRSSFKSLIFLLSLILI